MYTTLNAWLPRRLNERTKDAPQFYLYKRRRNIVLLLRCYRQLFIFNILSPIYLSICACLSAWRSVSNKSSSDTGLPDGEDRILLRSLVLTQYRSVTDRQTAGRICRSIYRANTNDKANRVTNR